MEKLFDAEKIEARLREVKSIDELTGKDGSSKDILKSTVERLLKSELDVHLGYPAHDKGPKATEMEEWDKFENREDGEWPD